jgi:hypothetical protein
LLLLLIWSLLLLLLLLWLPLLLYASHGWRLQVPVPNPPPS